MKTDAQALSSAQVSTLESQGCRSSDWTAVQATPSFDTGLIRDTEFCGNTVLGRCRLDRVRLSDCTVADGAVLRDVGVMARVDVEAGVVAERVGSLVCEGESSFGNGVAARVVNESGGREVLLGDRLSAQMAYLLAMHRHDQVLCEALRAMLETHAVSRRAARARVCAGASVRDCVRIRNVHIGPSAALHGCQRLEEGTVASCREDPTVVGDGVIAGQFVVLEGGRVENRAILRRTLVGQGARVSDGFAAYDCLLFANCDVALGEAASVLAGPFTVSHHASTLLIAGYCSFFNAGSGTNFSNHRYKSGPVHQGVLLRGAKTGSFSYMLWPSRVGAYSTVVGRHYGALDTASLPFSLIREDTGHTWALPAAALMGCGLWRDEAKWATRDRRKVAEPLDIVDTAVLSPWTVSAMIRGRELLQKHIDTLNPRHDYAAVHGVRVKRSWLETGRDYYGMATDILLGETLAARLARAGNKPEEKRVRDLLGSHRVSADMAWVDLCGMVVPEAALEHVLTRVRTGEIDQVDGFNRAMHELHAQGTEAGWAWCAALLEQRLGAPVRTLPGPRLKAFVAKFREAGTTLLSMAEMDLGREFDQSCMTGYGADGGPSEREADFTAVRGAPESSSVADVLESRRARIEEQCGTMEEAADVLRS